MFTFKFYVGDKVSVPNNRVPDINAACMMAEHWIANYEKIEVIFNEKVVVKTLTNDNPIVSTTLQIMANLIDLLRKVEVLLETSDVRNDIIAYEIISQVKTDLMYGVEVSPESMDVVNMYRGILNI